MRRKRVTIVLAVTAAAGLAGCAETGARYYRPITDYPEADGALGEKLAPGEAEAAARVAAIIEAHLHQLYAAGPIYRDAHPKADGCVRATFTVDADLPAPLRQGLFHAAGSYDAVVRFSNSNEDRRRPDTQGDGRGMAIKVYGIPGTPLTQDPHDAASQDFILINHPTFIVADPTRYRELVSYTDSANRFTKLLAPVLAFLSLGPTGTRNAVATTSSRIDDPLNTRYWSMVPYQLGPRGAAVAVKYSAVPCSPRPVVLPATADPDYLRHAMAVALAPGTGGRCMRFLVQPRTSAAMSVEDSRIEWPENAARFYPVATITLPPQRFDTPQRNSACDQLSYSPWHALPEHKPLGAVNRMRKAIYERISALRRASAPPPGTTE